MDDAARRVNPIPVRALLRCRQAREQGALREVQRSIHACHTAEQRQRHAIDTQLRHEDYRHAHEAGLHDAMRGRLQTAARILTARDELEALAEHAVNLATDRVDAVQARLDARDRLAEARQLHARRARQTRKWQRTLDRVETAHRTYRDEQDETELDDEIADRRASQTARTACR